jgi:beta-glucanase (GH16 family)
VSDLHEITASPDGPPPPQPPRRRRVALIVLACVVVAALVSMLVVVLRGSNLAGGSAQPTSGQDRARPTLDPSERSDTEAAVRNNWTLIDHDEFDGDELDKTLWSPYRGRTTDDVGQHDPDNLSVSGGSLKLTSRGLTSAGMAWDKGQKHGRWEVRVRSQAGNGYGPVLLLWPDAEDWPEGGEIDFMEIPKGDRTKAHFNLHWGEDDEQDGKSVEGDFTQWHTFAVEWTPDHVVGYVDGVQTYRNDDSDAIPPRSMHLAVQQDIGPYGNDWIPAPDDTTPEECTLELDWVRIYAA